MNRRPAPKANRPAAPGVEGGPANGSSDHPATDTAATRRVNAWVWAGFALLLVVAPLVFRTSFGITLLSQMGIAIIVCLSYNLLLGQGGMLSFGHAIYSGAGSFLAIHSLVLVNRGLPLPVSLIPVVGGMAGLALALLLGWVTTRRSSTPFAMITLGVGELVWALSLLFPQVFGGEAGVSANRVGGAHPFGLTYGPRIQLYYLIATYTLVCAGLMFAFTRTPLGRLLHATRDNPERMAFVGYDPRRVRYLAFAISAFFAGVSGGLAALHFEIVTSEVLSSYRSGSYLLFTFLGGTGFFFGPVVGAVLMVLATVFLSELTRAWLLYVGLMFVAMVMFAPGGVAGLLAAHVRAAMSGTWRRLLVSYGLLAVTSLAVLGGVAVLVEMLYHVQLDAALGPMLPFLGLSLDTGSVTGWWLATLWLLVWAVALDKARRNFRRRCLVQHNNCGTGHRKVPW